MTWHGIKFKSIIDNLKQCVSEDDVDRHHYIDHHLIDGIFRAINNDDFDLFVKLSNEYNDRNFDEIWKSRYFSENCSSSYLGRRTFLYEAVSCQRLDMARYLMDKFNLCPNDSKAGNRLAPPIFLAVHNNDIDMTRLLLDRKANIRYPFNGLTILQYSILSMNEHEHKSTEIIELLIDHGANPNMTGTGVDDCKVPPLLIAHQFELVDAMKVLINHGGDECLDSAEKMKILKKSLES